jgi:hypothetical protein
MDSKANLIRPKRFASKISEVNSYMAPWFSPPWASAGLPGDDPGLVPFHVLVSDVVTGDDSHYACQSYNHNEWCKA